MKVSVGVVHGDKIDGWFFHMIMGLLTSNHTEYELRDHVCVRSGPLLAQGRGQLLGSFIHNTTSDALLMVDSDQHATPDVLYSHIDAFRRLREQDPEIGVLAGITFISKDPKGDVLYPNLWVEGKHPLQMQQLTMYPKDSLIDIAAAGGSNMIIGRDVAQHFVDENINPFHHFNLLDYEMLLRGVEGLPLDEAAQIVRGVVNSADQLGEDLSFCRRVKAAGWKLRAHTGIVYEHSKTILLDEAAYDAAVARHTAPVEPVLVEDEVGVPV